MFLDQLQKRRSIRKYQAKPVEKDKIDQIVEGALRSPSSRGRNPWKFVVVTDKNNLKKLAVAKEHGGEFLSGAPLAIVVVGDPAVCDVWVEDTSIASIIVQLTAESLGLGSCWVQIRDRKNKDVMASDYICELLDIPAGLTIEAIIGIGYPAETPKPHAKSDLEYNKVFYEKMGK